MSYKPDCFNNLYTGVKYRLNSDGILQEVRIEFNGRMTKRIFNNDTFEGIIVLDNHEYNNCHVSLDKNNSGTIHYYSKTGSLGIIGKVYFNNRYNSLTIALYEKIDWNSSSWDSEDGLMITAPATNRKEAIRLANSHLESILKKDLN